MARHEDVTGLVLGGGAGRRMGTPKPLLQLGDRTLIEHVVGALQPLVAGIIIVTNDAESLGFLGLPTVGDAEPGRGPLMGLYSGLLACPTPYALAAACDAPFLSPPLLAALVEGRRPDAVRLPETEHGVQPLPGVYPSALAPTIASLLAAGRNAMRDLTASATVDLLPVEVVRTLDPEGRSFADLDTPEELAAARALLEGRG